jgi:hypothetical protein
MGSRDTVSPLDSFLNQFVFIKTYPYDDQQIMGIEKQYTASADSDDKSLKGERFYKVHLPPVIPSCKFWSVIVYDSRTQFMIHTDQPWPSVYSRKKGLMVNKDGSVDIFFGPADRSGGRSNFIKTAPGKSWFMIMRLYDLSEPVDENGWKPGGIEEVNNDQE